MLDRLKKAWQLTGPNTSVDESGNLHIEAKPEKRPATIIQDDPMEVFPVEQPENI